MGYEVPIVAGYTTLLFVLFSAWVGGYLDPVQHQLQDLILGKMGDNRASYGVKGLMSQKVTDDKSVNAAQDSAAQNVGGQVGKGGAGQGVGETLSKGL